MNAIETTIIEITPEMASVWLEANTNNRPVSKPNVKNLARQIKDGSWQLNGESIKFSSDGTLIDGQHRLHACIEADKPIKTLVMKGLDKEAFKTLDTGRNRNASDAIALTGEKNTVTLAAGIRAALLLQAGDYTLQRKTTNAEVVAYLEANPEIRQFALPARQTGKLCGAPIYCGFRYLTFKADPQKSALFWEMLETGVGITERHPVKALRDRLVSNLASSAKLHPADLMGMFIKAWNYFIKGKKVTYLRFDRTKDDFPEIV